MAIKGCKFCYNSFEGIGQQKFCSTKCRRNNYYKNNKVKIIKTNHNWALNNPEKARKYNNMAVQKWIRNNPERFKEIQKRTYEKNKDKHICRKRTCDLLLYENIWNKILKIRCKICYSKNNLEIHHEIYPPNIKDIIKAMKEGRIYCLCHKHHILKNKKYSKS